MDSLPDRPIRRGGSSKASDTPTRKAGDQQSSSAQVEERDLVMEHDGNSQDGQNRDSSTSMAQDSHQDLAEQESDMELDLLAESESDSDDNQSSHVNETSTSNEKKGQSHSAPSVGGIMASSLALFSDDDDSDDSTQQEEENEDDDSDENDSEVETTNAERVTATTSASSSTNPNTAIGGGSVSLEEFALGGGEDQPFERRGGLVPGGSSGRSAAPGSMQWAIRSRDSTSGRPGTNGLVFIDHASSIRRSAAPAAAVSAPQQPTMSFTATALSRAFNIIMR